MGGHTGEGLTPVDIIRFTGAYGMWLKDRNKETPLQVVVGRDARISGPMVNRILVSTLQAMGIDVIDAGISTTPTIEMAVIHLRAHGGIIITASHNPMNWNALKLLTENGEFLTSLQGEEMQQWLDFGTFEFVHSSKFGKYIEDDSLLEMHIEKILELPLVDSDAIRAANYKVVIDGINSSGGIAIPLLLQALGVKHVFEINCDPSGHFQHNPEPLPEHLQSLADEVVQTVSHVGFAVDPDVDRLAIVQEDGGFFGEEYTLVSVADYVLSHTPGNTVSNLSSTQALADVTKTRNGRHYYAPVGEVNVVAAMKKHKAVIGGEGNGGVIYPVLHYGRDALVGIALFLTQMAKSGLTCSTLKKKYPEYYISKNKIELTPGTDIRYIMEQLKAKYQKQETDVSDGLKIWFDKEWVHIRTSNTEPIMRIYSESDNEVKSENIANNIKNDISEVLKDL
jgi:phosphomannomutase